jgi:hypothetical protein
MDTRTLIFVTSLTFCGFSVTGVAWQSRHLLALREEGHRLRQQLEDVRAEAFESTRAAAEPVVSPPSDELLRLRNQVSQLTRRERELAGVQSENERLRMQMAAARTNNVQLPASFIRKSEARNLGYATPEATLETFLWAARNRDLTAFLACFTPEMAAQLNKEIERTGSAEKFFEKADALPGINVLGRVDKSDDRAAYKVELMPGTRPDELLLFRRINGEWRMEDD